MPTTFHSGHDLPLSLLEHLSLNLTTLDCPYYTMAKVLNTANTTANEAG